MTTVQCEHIDCGGAQFEHAKGCTSTPADDIQLSQEQEDAVELVRQWYNDPNGPQIFRLFGYAGTGKTTIAKVIAKRIKKKTLFACFTGKAAHVLRQKGCDGASTIHSLIYRPVFDSFTGACTFVLNHDSPLADADILIVDEVSMVGEELGNDVLSFKKRILVLGDPAQLPPVKGTGFFINEKPNILLTEIHRQAAENPIIQMSMDVRKGKPVKPEYGEAITILNREDADLDVVVARALKADQTLCGRNLTRVTLNRRIRAALGRRSHQPEPGDRLVCLRNDQKKGIFNGSLWDVVKVKKSFGRYKLDLQSCDDPNVFVDVEVLEEFFNGKDDALDWKKLRGTQQFTYGYVLTVHKAQGSQWDNVLLFDESQAFMDDAKKHLYTGITRAAERLTVIR